MKNYSEDEREWRRGKLGRRGILWGGKPAKMGSPRVEFRVTLRHPRRIVHETIADKTRCQKQGKETLSWAPEKYFVCNQLEVQEGAGDSPGHDPIHMQVSSCPCDGGGEGELKVGKQTKLVAAGIWNFKNKHSKKLQSYSISNNNSGPALSLFCAWMLSSSVLLAMPWTKHYYYYLSLYIPRKSRPKEGE